MTIVRPKPTEESSPPPLPLPQQVEGMPRPAEPNEFKIRIYQKIEGDTTSTEWTLLDSNERTVTGPDTTPSIPGSTDGDGRSEIEIEVREPANKDKNTLLFKMKEEVGNGCRPFWTTAPSDGSEGSTVEACNEALTSSFGCDDTDKLDWKELDSGFERTFLCRWLDESKVTVGLG